MNDTGVYSKEQNSGGCRYERLTAEEKSNLNPSDGRGYICRGFFSKRVNRILVLILGIFCVLLLLAQLFYPYSSTQLDLHAVQKGPSHQHWLGTNQIGQDIFAALLSGVEVSLLISFCAAVLSVIVGTVYGMICGFLGGTADLIMFRFTEIISSIPAILWIFLLSAVLKKGLLTMILVLSLCAWSSTACLIRGRTMEIKSTDYILEEKCLGANIWHILFRHILPNCVSMILVQIVLLIPNAIFAESMMSYVGVGIQTPDISLGILLSQAVRYINVAPQTVP